MVPVPDPVAGFGEGPFPRGPEAVRPQPLQGVLEPALGRVVDVAVGHEHVDQGLGRGHRVAAGQEVGQLDGQRGRSAEAAAAPQLVAGSAVDDGRNEAAVVEQGVVAAPGRATEGEVDLAWELEYEGG